MDMRAESPVGIRDLDADPRFVARIRAAQVRQAYAAQQVGLPGNVAGMVLATLMQSTVAPIAYVAAWTGLAAAIFIARVVLNAAFRRHAAAVAETEDLGRWRNYFLAASTCGGLIWAIYGVLLFPYGGPVHETAGVTILVGLAAGGVSTLSALRAAYLLYMLPTLLPLVIRFAIGSETPHWILFVGVVVYIVFLNGASRNMHQSIVEGFRRRFALDALVADLTLAHEQANFANAHLSQVLSEQSAILEAATVGIAHLRDGVIQKCNPRLSELLGHEANALQRIPLRELGILPSADDADTIEATLAAGRAHDGDHELRRRDGSRIWCHIKATPIDPASPARGAIWVFVDVQERVEADRRIRHLAHHDPLTGLPNRILLRDRLAMAMAQARRHPQVTCLLLIDLDRFKSINDTFGHDVGDAVLVESGRRIARCVREGDTVARLGGDEFVVVLCGLRAREHAAIVARKLVAAMCAPITLAGHTLGVGASIGIAVFPDDGADADRLMKSADDAMYRVKSAGGGDFGFFADRAGASQGGVQNTAPSRIQP